MHVACCIEERLRGKLNESVMCNRLEEQRCNMIVILDIIHIQELIERSIR